MPEVTSSASLDIISTFILIHKMVTVSPPTNMSCTSYAKPLTLLVAHSDMKRMTWFGALVVIATPI
jgi:hypothetical protein